MQFFLLGLALLVLVLLVGRGLANADPKVLARNIRKIAGYGAIAVALGLAAIGRFVLAIGVAIFGFSLLGKSLPWPDAFGSGAPRQGQRSSVRTEMLEMTLDHDTGEMDGAVHKGSFAGRRLADLGEDELRILLDEAKGRDAQAAQLLEAYIARREMGGARGSRGDRSGGAAPGARGMTVEEAYAVLGLQPGVTREEIHQAHRALMKKYHPDQGGTTYLASKINEAKDVLMKHVG
jgi:DnaJ-domain-containing protein 1